MANFRTNNPQELANALEKQISKDLEKLNMIGDFTVMYGVPKGTTDDGQDLETIAKTNNYGSMSKGIPARPFLSTVKSNYSASILKDVGRVLEKAKSQAIVQNEVSKQDVMKLLEVNLALPMENYTKDNLLTGDWVANAPQTIKRKGSDKPLVDTSQLLQSIKGIVTE